MSTFGIFLAYPPKTELRAEGLGRLLAYLLKGGAARGDIRFVVACPSWMRDSLRMLCEAEDVPIDSYEVLSPSSLPVSLRIHRMIERIDAAYRDLGRRRAASRWRAASRLRGLREDVMRRLVSTHSALAFAGLSLTMLGLTTLLVVAVALHKLLVQWPSRAIAAATRRTRAGLSRNAQRLRSFVARPGDSGWGRRLYRELETAEANLLAGMINARDDVEAWYCPTAFWPQFNLIERPRLLCVPDLVLSRMPISFAMSTGHLGLETYRRICATVRGARDIVVFSEDVKQRTLVEELGCAPERVHVIRHGSNDLSALVAVRGSPDDAAATRDFCRHLLAEALTYATQPGYVAGFANRELRYLFCPTQARPNKNVLSLLRAYEYLLRRRGLAHKLVFTGDIAAIPEVGAFLVRTELVNDALSLRGLSVQQLAACYKLADVALNASLFEGGCPFTLSESLSVGTPALMGRIAVTGEVLDDPILESRMLFDPYDWRDIADKIEWAVDNRDALLQMQLGACAPLLARSWADAADDYAMLLARIAAEPGDRGNRDG